MVPTLLHQIGLWLDRFSDALHRWESKLQDVEKAYLLSDLESMTIACTEAESIHQEIADCKRERQELLDQAAAMGLQARHLKELSQLMDAQWPAIWTHRISQLELQLNRIQRLSITLWMSAYQSKSLVSEMLLVLATGRADTATYAPGEARSMEGGFLMNEAA
jgi:hypothetical protein